MLNEQIKQYVTEKKRYTEMECSEYAEGYVMACNDVLNYLRSIGDGGTGPVEYPINVVTKRIVYREADHV